MIRWTLSFTGMLTLSLLLFGSQGEQGPPGEQGLKGRRGEDAGNEGLFVRIEGPLRDYSDRDQSRHICAPLSEWEEAFHPLTMKRHHCHSQPSPSGDTRPLRSNPYL
jgi:hypothetical protein